MAAGDGSGRWARVTSEGGCEGDGNSKGRQAREKVESDCDGRWARGEGEGGQPARATARATGSKGNGR